MGWGGVRARTLGVGESVTCDCFPLRAGMLESTISSARHALAASRANANSSMLVFALMMTYTYMHCTASLLMSVHGSGMLLPGEVRESEKIVPPSKPSSHLTEMGHLSTTTKSALSQSSPRKTSASSANMLAFSPSLILGGNSGGPPFGPNQAYTPFGYSGEGGFTRRKTEERCKRSIFTSGARFAADTFGERGQGAWGEERGKRGGGREGREGKERTRKWGARSERANLTKVWDEAMAKEAILSVLAAPQAGDESTPAAESTFELVGDQLSTGCPVAQSLDARLRQMLVAFDDASPRRYEGITREAHHHAATHLPGGEGGRGECVCERRTPRGDWGWGLGMGNDRTWPVVTCESIRRSGSIRTGASLMYLSPKNDD